MSRPGHSPADGRAPRAALVVALLAGIGIGVAGAETVTFRVVPEQTRVRFAVSQFGVAMQRGIFERASGTIQIDADSKEGHIDIVVDTMSVSTGWELRDAFLRGEFMFDAVRHPIIRYHSTSLAFNGGQLAAIDGKLTLHGVTRPVRFDVSGADCAIPAAGKHSSCVATVTGRISRAAFGMSFAYPLVGDEVALDFAVTAFRGHEEGGAGTP